jgi:hypothetical protein
LSEVDGDTHAGQQPEGVELQVDRFPESCGMRADASQIAIEVVCEVGRHVECRRRPGHRAFRPWDDQESGQHGQQTPRVRHRVPGLRSGRTAAGLVEAQFWRMKAVEKEDDRRRTSQRNACALNG